jgi:acetyl-CoA acetyltransferase
MYEYGTRPEHAAMVKVAHSEHATNNPKALYKHRVTVDDVLSSRWIVKPLHLLDCCVETDNAAAIIVTGADRARDCPHPPVLISAVAGRVCKRRPDMHFQAGPVTMVAGRHAREILWRNAGVGPEEIDVTGSYDAFTFTWLLSAGRRRRLRQRRHDPARRQAAEQHERRPPVRGLHPWHQHGDRERPPAAPGR